MKRMITTLAAIAFVATMPAVAAATPRAALYKSKCAACHAADGSGSTPVGKMMKVRDLRSDAVQKQTDIELTKTVAGGKGKMPAFGKKLSTAEVESLIAFIRTLKK